VLRSGEVDLVQQRTGREARIETAVPDRILGLSAVLTFRNHHSTAIARTRAELSFIAEADLLRLVDDHPAIWFALLHQLSQDVMHTYDVIRRDFWRKSATPGRRSKSAVARAGCWVLSTRAVEVR
jgi:CRP-like cAMP-binding protein